jgi:tRNA A-37 threonylcarbamoyl transferase component Bud32
MPAPVGPGTVIAARYEILGSLGSGGMGVVFKAHDRVLDERVALKLLRFSDLNERERVARFRSEARLARRIRHRNVCAIYDYGEDGDLLYISMELVEGRNLRSILREAGALAREEAFDMALEIAEGLAAVHEAGILHRDLKPGNIMVDGRGLARVMDFGIAKSETEDATPLTGAGLLVGSPHYMSPEQINGRKLDQRSDIYALGLVIYEMFAGRHVFPSQTAHEVMKRHLEEEPLEGDDASRLPPGLAAVLVRALDKEPARRFASCGEMRDAIRRARGAQSAHGADVEAARANVLRAAAPAAHRPAPESWLLVPMLVRALDHADPGVRSAAARALARTPDREAESALRAILEDPNSDVRLEAAAALEALRSTGAIVDPLTSPREPRAKSTPAGASEAKPPAREPWATDPSSLAAQSREALPEAENGLVAPASRWLLGLLVLVALAVLMVVLVRLGFLPRSPP